MTKTLEFLIAWIVGLVLAWSAFAHLGNSYAFLDAVMQYGLVPGPLARLVAVFAPWFQLVLAFCLISGVMRDAAFRLALLMFLGFAFVQTYAYFTGLGIPCGCFGASDAPIGPVSLTIVYTMLGLTAVAIKCKMRGNAECRVQNAELGGNGSTTASLLLGLILLSGSQASAQELKFPADSREESARIVTAALFHELGIDAEASHMETPKEIADTLASHGLHDRYFENGRLGDLKRAKSPTLLLWKNDWSSRGNARWVLLLEIRGNAATVIDPAADPVDKTTVSTAELLARWDGRGMFVGREETIAAPSRFSAVLAFLPMALFVFAAYLTWELRREKAARAGQVPSLTRHCVIILLVTLLLGGAYHLITPTGLLRNPTAAKIVTGRFGASVVPELSLAETKERLKDADVLLLDTRPADKFAEGSIPGAINFPIDATLEQRATLLADVPRSKPVILFCKSNRCPYADDFAQFLRHNGFENVSIYRDGFSRWPQQQPE